MGWNTGYTIYEKTVIEVYNSGALTPELLRTLIEPYQDTDIDHGGSKGLKAHDGLDADEIVVKLLNPEAWEEYLKMPRPPEDPYTWTPEQETMSSELYWFMYDKGGAWREIMKSW